MNSAGKNLNSRHQPAVRRGKAAPRPTAEAPIAIACLVIDRGKVCLGPYARFGNGVFLDILRHLYKS